MIIIGLLLAVLIGLSIGLLGGGGAILAVPIFVYVLGFGTKEAVASSLVVVGTTSLLAVTHWREGNVTLRVALIFGVFAMAGAYLGAQLAVFFGEAVQLILLAVVMLAASFFMFRDNEGSDEDEGDGEPEGSSIMQVPLGCAVGLAVLGVAVGVLTGLVGVGGGFLIVPGLALLADVSMKQAVGSSVLIIAANSVSGFVGYLGKVELQWGLLALFAALAIAGSFAGTYLVRFVPRISCRRRSPSSWS